MLWSKRDPEKDRWYLLPAMQHGARRKFYQRLIAAIIVGLITAGALATIIYLNNRI
jgi:hypothetical protein